MPELITKAAPEQTPDSSVIKETTAFFNRAEIPPPVRLTQYDNLPFIAVHLVEGDEDYTVPDGAAVNIRMKKPDGTWVYNPAYGLSTDRHTAYIECTTQMTAVPGQCAPIIEVVVDGQQAGTAYLHFDVDRNPVQEDDVQSTDEGKTIQQLAQEAKDAADAAADSEDAAADSAIAAAKSATAAANSASAAKTSQNAAASSASAAASSASAANTAKTEAQTAATNAKDSADAAADSAQQAAIEAQKALGFRSFYGGQILPEAETGDLDPSRPMSTPTAASVTIKARGDRIAGLTMAGKTTQAGTGDPSPENIRMIRGIGWYDAMIVWDGSSDESIWLDSAHGGFFTDFPASAPEANWYISNPAKSNWMSVLPIGISSAELPDYSIMPNHPSIGQRRIRFKVNSSISTVSDARAYLADHPLYFWYHSKDYYKSKGPFYTVVELSDDPYRAVGFELNQPLFDGDSLKVGGKSGFDKMLVLDGSENEGWVAQNASNGMYRTKGNIANDIPWSSVSESNVRSNYLRVIDASWADIKSGESFTEGAAYYVGVCISSITTLEAFKSYLSAHPLTVFYRSVNYTPENDIPVALETHTRNYLIFDGTEVVTATTSGANTPYLQIADVADNHGPSHRLVSSVAPFVYSYGGAGAFADYDNIVFGKAWCQSNGFANTETMVEDFRSFLTAQYSAGTPVQVVYELATPVSYARPVPAMIAQPGEDGTFTVTGENSLSVLLKAFQDGGDAATLGGQTLAQINAYNDSTYLTKEQLLTLIYPVGSIYMSANATDPGTLFGGTWARIQGRFLLAADGSHAAGSTGGEENHTLSAAELPSYAYYAYYWEGRDMERLYNPDLEGTVLGMTNTGGTKQLPNVAGGDRPHNNMPPYLAVYCWQRTA